MEIVEYPFPDEPAATGYCVFPTALEDEELVLFHATLAANLEAIIKGETRPLRRRLPLRGPAFDGRVGRPDIVQILVRHHVEHVIGGVMVPISPPGDMLDIDRSHHDRENAPAGPHVMPQPPMDEDASAASSAAPDVPANASDASEAPAAASGTP
jgi:hypothetical protein